MSSLITFNGSSYIIPATGEVGWGSNTSNYLIAIAAGCLQKTGGAFTLSAETDFGATYGLKSAYYKSRATNVASAGAMRLANAETGIVWRNFLNNADLALTVNASNQLTFNGTPIESNSLTSAHILVGNVSNIATDVAMSGNIGIDNTGATTIQAGVIVNSMVNASAAITYSKLNLTGGIVNADVNASAAIAYSKLNLALSIVNADVSTSAAIAYSKLNLTGSIVNADVNASAAIAYSKLNLSASIVNADISASAAIAITKIVNGAANQVLGTNAGASANEWKTLTSTSNQVTVTHGVGTVTFSTPQDIATASAVRFGSLTLGGALDASSILSLISTSKGFLPPVMTTTQKNAISGPTDGLIVYDSSLAQLFLRSASAWTPLSVGGGSGTVSSGTANQLTYYASSGTTVSGLTAITASRALASDANGLPVAATTTATELGYVNGVTSAIQTQLNTKAPIASPTFTGTVTAPILTVSGTSGTTVAVNSTDLVVNSTNHRVGIGVGSPLKVLDIRGASDGLVLLAPTDDTNPTNDIFQLTNAALSNVMTIRKNGQIRPTGMASNGNISFTTTSTQGIVGTTTNDSAAAGNVGEVITATATGVNMTGAGNFVDVTSISLTAGDWLISGLGRWFLNGTTCTQIQIGISTTAGNSMPDQDFALNTWSLNAESVNGWTGGKGVSCSVSNYHVQLSGTTTYYWKARSGAYTGTAPQFDGRISATRIR